MANTITSVTQQSPSGIVNPVRGVYIPKGSLDIWKAARNASGTTRAEVSIFGDSTTYGQGPTPFYSWVTKLRNLSIAAGYADGGRGFLNTGILDTTALSAPDPLSVSAITGFAAAAQYTVSNFITSTAANDTVTFNVPNTCARIWWTRFTNGGYFSYSINGAAAVVVAMLPQQPIATSGNPSFWSPDFLYLSGMPGGQTNTIKIVNLGGNPAVVPSYYSPPTRSGSTGGSLTVGTHYYVVTRVVGGGETGPSSVLALTTTAGNQSLNVSVYTLGSGTFNLYRCDTSSTGTYGYVNTFAASGGTYTTITDDGSISPVAGHNPPGSNPANLYDPQNLTVAVSLDLMNATGLVYHNHGVPGTPATGWFGVANDCISAAALLGLQQGLSSGNTISAYPSGTTAYPTGTASELLVPTIRANARHPALAIMCLGINDVQQSAPVADTQNAVALFVRMARNAGADPLVIVPTLESCNNSRALAGTTRNAIYSMAASYNCAIVDFNEALGPYATWAAKGYGGGNSNPHLLAPAYDAEATFLWNNCLSL